MLVVEEDILVYAFRYALGRKTYCVDDVTMSIRHNWDLLDTTTKKLIHKEVKSAIETNNYGMDMDKKEWLKILKLEIDE